jgi:glycosyltransferase involved in cell wall biosynthesis
MRILVVTQYFWPESFRINDVVQGLRALGHEVAVLTGKPNYPEGRFFNGYRFLGRGRESYDGVTVLRVPLLPRGGGNGFRLLLNYLSFAVFASLLGPIRCRGRIDLILVYEPSPVTVGLPALILKALKRAPMMFWVQDLWPESLSATGAVRSGALLKLVARLVRFIYRGSDRVLVQSRAFIGSVQTMGAAAERILYLPNSAETLYRPLPRASGVVPPPAAQGFKVMFAGNIGAAQSFETILGAAEKLRDQPEIHWLVLGDGRLHGWVQGEIGRRGLGHCVHLLGRHPVESMPVWFAHADVMLVTLRKDPIFALTIPSKVQSYMACARPILAALEGEGARVVEEARAGLVVPPEDPSALASGVLKMYRMSRGERERMGEQGRAYFLREFERGMLLARLDGWMRELAGGKAECAS